MILKNDLDKIKSYLTLFTKNIKDLDDINNITNDNLIEVFDVQDNVNKKVSLSKINNNYLANFYAKKSGDIFGGDVTFEENVIISNKRSSSNINMNVDGININGKDSHNNIYNINLNSNFSITKNNKGITITNDRINITENEDNSFLSANNLNVNNIDIKTINSNNVNNIINQIDNINYTSDGVPYIRVTNLDSKYKDIIFNNATTTNSGLLSKEDKLIIDKIPDKYLPLDNPTVAGALTTDRIDGEDGLDITTVNSITSASYSEGDNPEAWTTDGQTKPIGEANGLATLDENGKVPVSQLGNIDTQIVIVVSALPTVDIKTNKIYLVPNSAGKDDNVYSEYLYINNKWEKLGEYKAEVNLSSYAKLNANNVFTEGQTVKGLDFSGGTSKDGFAIYGEYNQFVGKVVHISGALTVNNNDVVASAITLNNSDTSITGLNIKNGGDSNLLFATDGSTYDISKSISTNKLVVNNKDNDVLCADGTTVTKDCITQDIELNTEDDTGKCCLFVTRLDGTITKSYIQDVATCTDNTKYCVVKKSDWDTLNTKLNNKVDSTNATFNSLNALSINGRTVGNNTMLMLSAQQLKLNNNIRLEGEDIIFDILQSNSVTRKSYKLDISKAIELGILVAQ